MIGALLFYLLLYFAILNVLLLTTCYFSLKIVKTTIGKNIKEQFNKSLLFKLFWLMILSYMMGIIPLFSWVCYDFKSSIDGIELIIVSILLSIYGIFVGLDTTSPLHSDQEMFGFSITILSTFLISIFINYAVVFKKLDLKKSKRFLASLIVSAMTAPYFYFVSFAGFLY